MQSVRQSGVREQTGKDSRQQARQEAIAKAHLAADDADCRRQMWAKSVNFRTRAGMRNSATSRVNIDENQLLATSF